jgi:hypothetical protein
MYETYEKLLHAASPMQDNPHASGDTAAIRSPKVFAFTIFTPSSGL